MIPYRSKSRKPSGVIAYEIGRNFITVKFENKAVYTYSNRLAGKKVVDLMKLCAKNSIGLSTFISQYKPPYDMEIKDK